MEGKVPNKNENLGNTLDYFHDDMARKPVGRLMQDLDEVSENGSESDTGTIVGNYYDKNAELKISSEEQKPEIREPEVIKAEAAEPSARIRRGTGDKYDISMYSREREILDDEEFEEIMRPRRSRVSSPEPAIIKRNEPPREYMPPRRRPATAKEPMSYMERAQSREKEEVARTLYTRSRNNLIQPYIFGVFFILLIIMAVLIVRMNSLSSRLKEAETKQQELTEEVATYTEYKIQNDAYAAEIERLTKALEERPEPTPEPEINTSENPSTVQPQQTPEQTLPTTYTVNSGDSLTRISQKFYKTPNLYEKIKTANGLTSDNIVEGMVLTIPK